MRVSGNVWQFASRDLFKVTCSHCTHLEMAVAAKVPSVLERVAPYVVDVGSLLPVRQGVEYEEMVFGWLKERLGQDFLELERATMQQTLDALRAGTPVVAQGFFEAKFGEQKWSGYADLLIREDFELQTTNDGRISITKTNREISDPKYVVWDVKATSRPSDYYWTQLASYSEILEANDLCSKDDLGLILIRGNIERAALDSSLEHLTIARNALLKELNAISPQEVTEDFVTSWHCPSTSVCSSIHCPYPDLCKKLIEAQDPLSLIYDMRHQDKFMAAGFTTLTQVANHNQAPEAITPELWQKYHESAKAILKERTNGPSFELKPKNTWQPLPKPSKNDIFFDIEWFKPVNAQRDFVFMFGSVEADESFVVFESPHHQDEKQIFEDFVQFATAKMQADPDARIYHYTNPEVRYLRSLAEHYQTHHDEVEYLVTRMVDLKVIAASMLIVGSGSYSIKKLERYYDADTKLNRGGLVAGGADAQSQFDYALKALPKDPAEAQRLLQIIQDYNRDDCLSTKLLRDWLLTL